MAERRTPPKVPRPSPAPLASSAAVPGSLTAAELAEFWRTTGAAGPLIEPQPGGDCLVTFWWRDSAAAQVLLFVNRLTDERTLPASLMERVPGTDLWHLTYRMTPDWRASYGFVTAAPGEPAPWEADQVGIRGALDLSLPDPGNPLRCRNRRGHELSVVELPQAPTQTWLAPRGPMRPAVEVPVLAGHRVWLREATAPGPRPLVIVLDGEYWRETLPATIDNLVADGLIREPHLALVEAGDLDRRWQDLGEDGFSERLAGELLSALRDQVSVSADPSEIVVVGQSLGALTALRTVLTHPDRIGAALSQSASLWLAEMDPRTAAGLRIHLEVGRQEWVLHEPNRQLARRLSEAGAEVRFVEYNGGHDYACWRGGIAEGLSWLLAL